MQWQILRNTSTLRNTYPAISHNSTTSPGSGFTLCLLSSTYSCCSRSCNSHCCVPLPLRHVAPPPAQLALPCRRHLDRPRAWDPWSAVTSAASLCGPRRVPHASAGGARAARYGAAFGLARCCRRRCARRPPTRRPPMTTSVSACGGGACDGCCGCCGCAHRPCCDSGSHLPQEQQSPVPRPLPSTTRPPAPTRRWRRIERPLRRPRRSRSESTPPALRPPRTST